MPPLTSFDIRRLARLPLPGGDSLPEVFSRHTEQQAGETGFLEAAPITLGASAARSVIVAFTLPAGMIGMLRYVATALQNAADWENIRWALQDNGTPILGLDNLQGPIANILYPYPILYPLKPGHTVRWVVTNNTSAAIPLVTAMLRGTYWPMGH